MNPLFTTRSVRNLLLASAVAMTLTACGTQSERVGSDRYEGNLKIGNPYNIDGQIYNPKYDPAYDETGVASWYGPGFHGRSTANGERFDQHAMTAAHRTLPLPSMVRVTNLENGKSAIVKVNDRGPFKKDRIIDLSKEAATKIDMLGKGTAEVRVEYLEAESKRLIADLVKSGKLSADAETLHAMAISNLDATPKTKMAMAASAVPTAKEPGKMASFFGKLNPFKDAEAAEPEAASNAPAQLDELPEGVVEAVDSSQGTAFAAPNRAEANSMPTRPVMSRDLAAPTELSAIEPAAAAPQIEPTPMPGDDIAASDAVRETQPQEMQMASVDASPEPAMAEMPVAAGYYVQAGSFSQADNARTLAEKLASLGQATVKPVEVNGRTWYRVRLGPLANHGAANQALSDVQGLGVRDARVVHD